ncbi:MAG: PKD domain-containing protein, partial [Candidatus Promineifilaceae bacterium]|nr:PKD domain-containing protein [Candidatus Promineifilaceae bacterium]
TTGLGPLTVSFDNLSSGDYLTCLWQFGDGGSISQCDNPSHTYNDPGIYSVSLTVDGPGGMDQKTIADYVVVSQAVVDFSATPINGQAPLTVLFDNLSQGQFESCLWKFGDGDTSTACSNVSHIYQVAGSYTVELTMNGASGSLSQKKEDYIVVEQYFVIFPIITR